MLPILAQYSQSLPKMDLPLPELPPPDLLLLSLSTAAWVAALTAAFGLWRFGASGAQRPKSTNVGSPPFSSPPPAPVGPTELTPAPRPTPPVTAPAPVAACHVEGALGSPRSRFTVSYSCDNKYCHVEEGDDQEGGEVVSDWEVTGPRWMGMRGDLGWYRYQDRTAIDGSVVRLWDGGNGGLTARRLSLMAAGVSVERGMNEN